VTENFIEMCLKNKTKQKFTKWHSLTHIDTISAHSFKLVMSILVETDVISPAEGVG